MASGISGHRHNLPAETVSFVGREAELAALQRLMLQARLLTLTGVGGSGKTRLALHLAASLVPSFADGVWLVPLAPLTDSGLLPRVVAAAVGIRGTAGRPLLTTLTAALTGRRLMLVLDNCEHLIGACARLAETLLGACPHLRILATSREPLRVPGETTWRVPPLALPGAAGGRDAATPELLAGVEAVALFLDRARARRPNFTLTRQNALAVTTICRRLEGLPLAIELAAAQVGVLSPAQIAGRLDDALRVLGSGSRTEPRQETLRGMLDWSYALLSDQEQILLRRLAVFAGSGDVEAIESICAENGITQGEVLPLLTALVEKSLVEPLGLDDAARYRLLEPVRQYAWEKLATGGETADLQRRHAQYVLDLAERAEPKLMSGERRPWMERLAREHDNLRAALSWSRHAAAADAQEVGLCLAGTLAFYWLFRGEISEGLGWVEGALAREKDAAAAARAKALYCAGELAWHAGQPALARDHAEESAALWRALGEKRWLAYTLQSLPMAIDNPQAEESVAESVRLFDEVGDAWGKALALAAPDLFALMGSGDPTGQGQARLEGALRAWRALNDDWGTAQVLNMLGDIARSQGNDDAATARYEEALTLLRRHGMGGTVPSVLHNLGYQALHRGDTRGARRHFREGLTLFRDQGDQRGMADCLDGLAGVRAALGQTQRAAELFGAAEALRQTLGIAIWPANASDYEHNVALVRSQLGETELEAAWAAGRERPVDQMVAEVLAEEPVPSPGDTAGTDLTPREREVAVLVAKGLTNRQIGSSLFITEGTARLHVKHVLQKLGFTSRAQIAAWAVEHSLAAAPETRLGG